MTHRYNNYRPLLKELLVIAGPAILEQTLNTALMFVDTLMISLILGKEALSAVGTSNSILYLLIFVFTSFNIGAVAMISRSYGEGDVSAIKTITENNLLINTLLGIGVTVCAYLLRKGLFLPYDLTETVRNQLYIYFDIVLLGMPFQFIAFAFAAASRGVGDTKTPLAITTVINVVNAVGNFVLMTGFWFFPAMGIAGAALATTLARVTAALIYCVLFFSQRHKIQLTLQSILKGSKDWIKRLWLISYPGAIESALMQGAFVIAGIFISFLETDSEAAFRILINIESTSFMPAVGISIAAATLVGKSIGEKNIEKALQFGHLSSILAILWGILVGTVFVFFPLPIISLFTKETTLLTICSGTMLVMGFNQPPLNYMIVMSGALRGAGDTKTVMHYTSLRLWLIFLPLTYFFIGILKTDVEGLWYAEILSFILFSYIITKRFNGKQWSQFEI